MVKRNFLTCFTAIIAGCTLLGCSTVRENRTTAFYYGPVTSLNLLSRYEQVVIESEQAGAEKQLDYLHNKGTDVYAYVSIGEINKSRPWYAEIPKEWLIHDRNSGESEIVDLTRKGWHEFLTDKYLDSLWKMGYRNFFFDTLDSYQRAFASADDRYKQERALADLIKKIHHNYPEAKLMLNRGFEILPEVSVYVNALVVESLFQSWDKVKHVYHPVTVSDRNWLLERLNKARKKYGVQIIVIDYVDPAKKELAYSTAQKIQHLGFTPWVTTPELNKLGVSSLEIKTEF